VYERLYAAAGLRNGIDFAPVSDEVFETKCPTLAAQAHALTTAVSYRDDYQDFVASGGNMMLQCRSVEIFEDPASDLFFTRYGIDGTTNTSTSDTTTISNPNVPFNQFVGDLARTNGYTYFNAINGTGPDWLASTVFTAAKSNNSNNKVAFWRDTTAAVGGVVMALGGHEYGGYVGDNIGLPGVGNDSVATNANYERVNGSRMALNAILVPSRTACSFNPPKVQGYKTVKLGTAVGDDVNPIGVVNAQDNVEWTVRYINTGSTAISNFQITDTIDFRLQFVIGSLTAQKQSTPAAAPSGNFANGSFNGTTVTSMLANNVTLGVDEMITVKFKTKVLFAGDIPNQATANGNGIQSPVSTDSADQNTPGTVVTPGNPTGYPIAGNCATSPTCYIQSPWVDGNPDNWTAKIEPTYISSSIGPTAAAAEISGRVSDLNGRAIAREVITLQSATTGELRTVMTNTFGYFRFADVTVGGFYVMSIKSKRYTYDVPTVSFSLEDSISGIQFIASRPGSSGNTTSAEPAPKTEVKASVAPSVPVKAAPVQRRTIVLSPVKKKALKDDEESDKDL
ncbi:MAG TPA: carboxypeptidase regulatory-like domain-containing protein, partial [Pyrinomonadaceae bacterium]|nr:carboxypeptidase regulatory-like domain-containing protein [Pyrinomonadaceae bacterium]